MKSIVLAAGIGKRLRPITNNTPKCLIQFDGKPLIDRYFSSLRKCGINEVVLVVGYLAETLKEKIGDKYMNINVKYVHNADYAASGSAYSFWLAKDEFLKKPFILADSDILFHERILQRLVNSHYENCLVVDALFADTGEEVKVAAENGVVKRIGKRVVDHSNCVGEAVGLYKFSGEVGELLGNGLEEYLEIHGIASEYEDALNDLLSFFEMHYITTQGLPWIEIDFPEDLEKARSVIYPKLSNEKGS